MASSSSPALNSTASNCSASHTTARSNPTRSHLAAAATLINRGGLTHSQAPPPQLPQEVVTAVDLYAAQFLPTGPKSLSGIALRSLFLGVVLALSATSSLYLVNIGHVLWRAPFFLATLCTFHYLEFYTTALANTPDAKVSSFLLMSNGPAYAIAHTAAFTECIIAHLYSPQPVLPSPVHYVLLALGLSMLVLGQTVRASAMLHCGPNFSHIVAQHKRSTHSLVTTGPYAFSRHPSYFGFFWWGIGTQLVCGNLVCFIAYAVVLWRFFQRRIEGEEELLVGFFGDEYLKYRQQTPIRIPFIR